MATAPTTASSTDTSAAAHRPLLAVALPLRLFGPPFQNRSRRIPILPLFAVARTHYALMDSRRNAIACFVVHFGHDVLVIVRGILQILLPGHVDEVAHNEALDRLVLGHGTPETSHRTKPTRPRLCRFLPPFFLF